MKHLYRYIFSLILLSGGNILSFGQETDTLTREDYVLEATGAYSSGDYRRAESLYLQAIDKFPDLDAAWFYLGLIHKANGQNDKAQECLLKASSLDTTNFWYLAELADLYIDMDRTEEAIPIYQSVSKLFPGKITPQIHLLLGDYEKSQGSDSLSIRHYEEALRISPEFSPAEFSLAEIYRVKGNFFKYFLHMDVFLEDQNINPSFKSRYLDEVVLTPQFVSTFKPQVDTMILCLLKAHPDDSAAIRTAASYYIRSDEKERGVDLYRRNVELYPDDHGINIEYVSVLYYLEEWDKLESGVHRMIEAFPEDETLNEVLAVALWHLGDIEGAVATYRKQLGSTKNPSIRLSCCTALGDLYQETGDLKNAARYYKKGISIDPEYIPLLNNYAYFLTKVGKDYQKGLKMSKKTILNEPDNPTYLDTYGWLLYLTGDYEDAKAQFKRAMLFGGKENGVIMDHYADVLWALKDYEMALIYYEQAAKLDPSLNIPDKIKARKAEIGR